MNIVKCIATPSRLVSYDGLEYEAGETFEIVGNKSLGMVGNKPNPAKFSRLELYYDSSGESFEVYVSEGVNWYQVRGIDDDREKSPPPEVERANAEAVAARQRAEREAEAAKKADEETKASAKAAKAAAK